MNRSSSLCRVTPSPLCALHHLGKTYTITGTSSDPGILPRSLDVIFNSVEQRHFSSVDLKPRHFSDVVILSKEDGESERRRKEEILNKVSVHCHSAGLVNSSLFMFLTLLFSFLGSLVFASLTFPGEREACHVCQLAEQLYIYQMHLCATIVALTSVIHSL